MLPESSFCAQIIAHGSAAKAAIPPETKLGQIRFVLLINHGGCTEGSRCCRRRSWLGCCRDWVASRIRQQAAWTGAAAAAANDAAHGAVAREAAQVRASSWTALTGCGVATALAAIIDAAGTAARR